MFYAMGAELHNKVPQGPLLDELDRVVSVYATDMTSHWSNARDPPDGLFEEYECKTFVASAIQAKLRLYVTQKLEAQPRLLRQKKGRPLLDYALRPTIVTPTQLPAQYMHIDEKLVRFLLDKRADPNQKVNIYDRRPVWDLFLVSWYQHPSLDDGSRRRIYYAAEMLIRHGVDPDVKCDTGKTSSLTSARYKRPVEAAEILSALEILKQVLKPDEFTHLEMLLGENRRSWRNSVWKMLTW